jgi:hypothetical protein
MLLKCIAKINKKMYFVCASDGTLGMLPAIAVWEKMFVHQRHRCKSLALRLVVHVVS